MKVLLILSDGTRPDALEGVGIIDELKEKSTYSTNVCAVIPSVTLPCHMSLFHSVDPSRHGTTTNTYAPQVRPIDGLCEQLVKKDKKCAFFYNWEQLRDLSRPGNLVFSYYDKGSSTGWEKSNHILCEQAVKMLKHSDIDFAFLYLGWVDEAGHEFGWMSEEYMYAVNETCKLVYDVISELEDEYEIIFTTDHGGHERMHGTDMDEDMTTFAFLTGKSFEKNKQIDNVSIKDFAPTIVSLIGADCAKEWEGKILK